MAQKGFTLIELLATIVIVGVLASMAMLSLQEYSYKARVAEAIVTMRNIISGQELYHEKHGWYYNLNVGHGAAEWKEFGFHNVDDLSTDPYWEYDVITAGHELNPLNTRQVTGFTRISAWRPDRSIRLNYWIDDPTGTFSYGEIEEIRF